MAEIEDTGVGISQLELKELFKPFEQAEGGKKIHAGTGLGLAISREFVRLMGGDITVASELGKGSIFRFELNVEECLDGQVVKKNGCSQVVGLQHGHELCRVLIADDRQDNRDLLSEMLGRIGFEVHEAANGEQAVHEFEKWRPKLILMDTRMPVMDGFEAIKRIRSCEGGEIAKIVSVTASAFDEDRKRALEIGADDFLPKPFREEDLLAKIKSLLAVEYIYANETPSSRPGMAISCEISKSTMAALPVNLLSQLHEATLSADLDQMLELTNQIKILNPDVAARMQTLVESYDYEKILELTDRNPRQEHDAALKGESLV
jgi:CheY-like chemotaxis protein